MNKGRLFQRSEEKMWADVNESMKEIDWDCDVNTTAKAILMGSKVIAVALTSMTGRLQLMLEEIARILDANRNGRL